MGTTGLCQDGSVCPGAESCWQQSCSFAFSPHHTLGQRQTPWRTRHKHIGAGEDSHSSINQLLEEAV